MNSASHNSQDLVLKRLLTQTSQIGGESLHLNDETLTMFAAGSLTGPERTAAIELAARIIVPRVDAMVWNTAQHGVADISSSAVLDIVPDWIAAARIANQGDPRSAGSTLQFLDGLAKFAALVLGRRFIRLGHSIVSKRRRIGKIDRKHPLARNANLPDDAPATDANREIKAEWLVVSGVCTHLGCTPTASTPQAVQGDFGGWLCHCHGSQYDIAGRVRVGPAPRNLEVPPYAFLSDTRLKIG